MPVEYQSPGVYVEEVDTGPKPIQGVSTAIAAFVGFTEKDKDADGVDLTGKPTLVTSWSQFQETFGGYVPDTYLASAVYGYFNNGGSVCYVTRLPGASGLNGSNGSNGRAAAQALPAPMVRLPSRGPSGAPSLEITARELTQSTVTVEVRPADDGAAEEQFTVVVRRGEVEEPFTNVTMGRGGRSGARNAVDVLNRDSALVTATDLGAPGTNAERAPVQAAYTLAAPEATALAPAGSTTIVEVDTKDFIGDPDARTGISAYVHFDDVTILCVPDLMAAYKAEKITKEDVLAVQAAMLANCELMQDRVAILDSPPDLNPQQIRAWRMDAPYGSNYGTLYYPWVQIANPFTGKGTIPVPPSGHIAGVWARTDDVRGVHKAPANETIRGVVNLAYPVSHNEQKTLNPVGINCIRSFSRGGILIWGARTLDLNNPSWRYLSVRRLFNFIKKSIEQGTQWVVFEPNDMDLWERVRRDITAFLTRVWRDGALFGATPAEAFYVKCDAELNTQEVRDAGQLIVEIGIAPVKPAEFVIFRISQWAPGT
jgi:phage tail sheath protein FI